MTPTIETETQALIHEAKNLKQQILSSTLTIENEQQFQEISEYLVNLNNRYKYIEDRKSVV